MLGLPGDPLLPENAGRLHGPPTAPRHEGPAGCAPPWNRIWISGPASGDDLGRRPSIVNWMPPLDTPRIMVVLVIVVAAVTAPVPLVSRAPGWRGNPPGAPAGGTTWRLGSPATGAAMAEPGHRRILRRVEPPQGVR